MLRDLSNSVRTSTLAVLFSPFWKSLKSSVVETLEDLKADVVAVALETTVVEETAVETTETTTKVVEAATKVTVARVAGRTTRAEEEIEMEVAATEAAAATTETKAVATEVEIMMAAATGAEAMREEATGVVVATVGITTMPTVPGKLKRKLNFS